jgi:chromosome segregation ATPase
MRDYAQYSSRIPTPSSSIKRGFSTTANTTRNVASHPLSGSTYKQERESTSTASSSTYSSPQHAPQHSSTPPTNGASLPASDALHRQGAEATINQLRQALDESHAKDATAKSYLAKSDAIILELRSSVRQFKRQIETSERQNAQQKNDHKSKAESQVEELQKRIRELQHQLAVSQSSSNDENVGELQIQLDRAHAQILTADMVRKELEDTLEAEQYTWDLRVQDQERTIVQLQQQIQTLSQDLETCRSQWKEAEVGWNSQLEDLQQQLKQARTRMATTQALKHGSQGEMSSKITQLEQERAELQSCLDEALQELEAVDAEVQIKNGTKGGVAGGSDKEVVESLQHLLRWILQESNSPSELHNMPRQSNELLNRIQQALEIWMANTETPQGGSKNVQNLQSQINVYEQELKSREKSSFELRESLKEAVALLKPLQDTVAKGEQEKKDLQAEVKNAQAQRGGNNNNHMAESQLREKTFKIRALEDEVVSLREHVEEHKQLATARESLLKAAANNPTNVTRNNDESMNKIQKAREELRRKRETEGNLQQLLRDAQTRFHSLHQQNEEVVANNRDLQGKLKTAEQRFTSGGEITQEDKLARYEQELARRNAEIKQLQLALQRSDGASASGSPSDVNQELIKTRNELAQKEQSELILNKSLKEALGLLKPLHIHLEDAEKEKMEISKELRTLRKRFRQLQMGEIDDMSKVSSANGGEVSVELIKVKDELEETVRQLELENSQLHDALEDMGEFDGADQSKVHQRMVELNSRYEVTQNKLEDAHVENHSLVKELKHKELQEKQRKEEIRRLNERLQKTENELSNAKAIVDEFAMPNTEKMNRRIPTQRQMV